MKEIAPGLLDEIVRRLVESLHPLEIYLFGSHAEGTPHQHSDVDLLVVVPDHFGDRHALATRRCGGYWCPSISWSFIAARWTSGAMFGIRCPAR